MRKLIVFLVVSAAAVAGVAGTASANSDGHRPTTTTTVAPTTTAPPAPTTTAPSQTTTPPAPPVTVASPPPAPPRTTPPTPTAPAAPAPPTSEAPAPPPPGVPVYEGQLLCEEMVYTVAMRNDGGTPVTFTTKVEGVDGFGAVTVAPGEQTMRNVDLGSLPMRRLLEGPVTVEIIVDGTVIATETVDVDCFFGSDNECPPVEPAEAGPSVAPKTVTGGFPWLLLLGAAAGAGAAGYGIARRRGCPCDETEDGDTTGDAEGDTDPVDTAAAGI